MRIRNRGNIIALITSNAKGVVLAGKFPAHHQKNNAIRGKNNPTTKNQIPISAFITY